MEVEEAEAVAVEEVVVAEEEAEEEAVVAVAVEEATTDPSSRTNSTACRWARPREPHQATTTAPRLGLR